MKRMAMYLMVIVQLVFISVLVYQFEQIDHNATEINILTKIDDMYDGDFSDFDDIYVHYDINMVPNELWTEDKDIDYNRPVYVTLTKNEKNIDVIKQVTLNKPENVQEDTILKANYRYRDSHGNHHIDYGFEWIKNINEYGTFQKGDRLQVTILLGKWEQQKVTNVEKVAD